MVRKKIRMMLALLLMLSLVFTPTVLTYADEVEVPTGETEVDEPINNDVEESDEEVTEDESTETDKQERVPVLTSVTINKLEYLLLDDDTIPTVENVGKEITEEQLREFNFARFDKSKYGEVGFTLFMLERYSDTLNKQEIITDVITNKENSEYVIDVLDEMFVDKNGQIKTELPEGDWLLVETTHANENLIKQPSSPMFLRLPVLSNLEGVDYETDIQIYPKNNVSDGGTHVLTIVDENGAPIEGATFNIYKVNEDGSYSSITDNEDNIVNFITDENGTISVSGLLRGKYIITEIEIENLVDGMLDNMDATMPKENVGEYLVGHNALLDEYNTLSIEVMADGTVVSSDDAQFFVNYKRPTVEKVLKTEATSFDISEDVPFTITVDVPKNIEDYSMFNVHDILSDNAKYVTDSFELYYGDTLIENEQYSIQFAEENTAFILDFIQNENLKESIKGLDKITLNYNVRVHSSEENIEDLSNDVVLSYNNSPNGNTKSRYDNDNTEFKTYGKKFVKVDSGIFWSLPKEERLEGAEFIISKNVEDNTLYLSVSENEEYSWVENKEDAFTFISNENGEFEVFGLAEGTYNIEEIKAPEGYMLSTDIIEFDVDEDSYSGKALSIANHKRESVPMTGSMQIVIYSVAVLAIIVLAVVLIKKKKENRG